MMNLENKFYKVSHSGGCFVTGGFYNPITKEYKIERLRDYEYSDCSRDNDELYYMDIDEEVRKIFLKDNGIITVGDVVEVFKGRKIPKGTIAKVVDIKPWYDRYHRWQCDYAIFEDGRRTNINNCRLIG